MWAQALSIGEYVAKHAAAEDEKAALEASRRRRYDLMKSHGLEDSALLFRTG